ncbi:MAG: hypothetical protein AAF493_11395 [Pseudomonadota bacterium]
MALDWMSIVAAILLGMMVIFLLPRAKQMLKESPKASYNEWLNALIPIALVALFIVILMQMV